MLSHCRDQDIAWQVQESFFKNAAYGMRSLNQLRYDLDQFVIRKYGSSGLHGCPVDFFYQSNSTFGNIGQDMIVAQFVEIVREIFNLKRVRRHETMAFCHVAA